MLGIVSNPIKAQELGNMFHKWIGNDNGVDCYRCGTSVDYPWKLDEDGNLTDSYTPADEAMEQEIHFFLPNCAGPTDGRGHHYFAIGADKDDAEHLISAIECHYGDAHIGYETDLAYVPRFCKGDSSENL
jgi:hypothetical protein